MSRIERIEILQVDLAPKVVRTDAIQSFVAQETPIVRVTCDDGAQGAPPAGAPARVNGPSADPAGTS